MKDYRNVDSVFIFVAAFIDRPNGCTKKAPMTVVYAEYSVLIRLVMN